MAEQQEQGKADLIPKDVQETQRVRFSRPASVLYNALLASQRLSKFPYVSKMWSEVWQRSCQRVSSPVRTTIHGRKVTVNYGHPYPLTSRRVSTFDNPIIELVFQAYASKGGPVTLVDVGANVGDTILAVDANCPGMLREFYCVDADPTFFTFLRGNLGHLRHGKILFACLSSAEGVERGLVRIHRGTASAQGGETIPCTTLDSLLARAGVRQIDVLKTDVDGLDGKVLLGAKTILERHQPAVIFEWHPLLCQRTSNNWCDHFDALERCGYERFVWFTKYGEFSHFTRNGQRELLAMLAEVCLRDRFCDDWHYDIVALPKVGKISHILLAECANARDRKSNH